MTTTLRALAIAATLAAGASPFLAPGGGLMAPAHAKKDKGPGFVPETFLNAAPVATGTVRRFLVNPHGEVDGLQLVDGTIVKFPPHMGQELTAAVKAADTVSVRGFREAVGLGKARDALRLIRALLRSGSALASEISEIDMSRGDGPVLYTVDGVEVRLGTEEWEERLARLEGVLTQIARDREAVRAIDLRFRDQVVLTRGGQG